MSQLSKVLKSRFDDAKTLINSQFRINTFLEDKGIHVENNRQIRCPFHDDSTPSFSVDTEANIWKCFGCPDGGHFIDIWIKYNNRYDNTNYNVYTAVEHILSASTELQTTLGFSSIFQSEEQQFDLFKDDALAEATEAAELDTSYFDRKLARPTTIEAVSTDSMKKVLAKLQKADIQEVISFIADCEKGFTEQQLISKYYKNQGDIDTFIYNLTNANAATSEEDEDYTAAFLEVLNS